MIETSLATYEDVAAEYYDPIRHPTCANFREASFLLLRKWFQASSIDLAWICEVGAGKSLIVELLEPKRRVNSKLVIIDSSPSMLSYSKSLAGKETYLVNADSSVLPLASNSMDLLVSSLGDPYNILSFWMEAFRVLRPGGEIYFTVPSYDWSVAFRKGRNSNSSSAEFDLLDGGRIYLPSWIHSPTEQIRMIETSGLLTRDHQRISLHQIATTPLSPKLLMERGPHAGVVEGYLVRKPQ